MTDRLPPDNELWIAIKNDDRKAFNCFFDRHWKKVFTTTFAITGDREKSAEIVNDIFLNLWIKRKDLNILLFREYLTASARYHVYRHLRNVKRNIVVPVENIYDFDVFSINNKADEGIKYQELLDEVDDGVKNLPKRCREIYTMSRKEHLSNDEIASRLVISKRTVETQITRALHQIRISLKSFF